MRFSKKLLAAALTITFAASSFIANAGPLSRKPQDNIFYATGVDAQSLDPALIDDWDSGNVVGNIYESLVKFKDENTDVLPSLATSWTISDDGLVYTFKLKEGVKFHDGTDFNAEAVKFNIDRQMPDVATPKMSYAGLVYGDVEKTTVIDEHTIEIKLKKKSTPFLHNIAMSFSAPIISPKALREHDNNVTEHPVGTGPYKFVAWDKGQQVILTRFDDYHGEKAKTQNLIIRTIPEMSARVVALNNGEIDMIMGVDSNVIPEIKSAGNIVTEKDSMSTNYMLFNCDPQSISPTKDKDVRRAIAMSVNVPELVEALYKGYSKVANSFLPSFVPGYSEEIKYPQYNVEEAKKIFKEKNVKSLKIIAYSGARPSNTVGGQVLAEAIQSYLAKAGVKSDIQIYDWATYRNKMLTDHFDIAFLGWNGDNGDPDNFLNIFATDDPIANNPRWNNKEYRDLIEQGLAIQDGAERNEIYKKAELVMAEETPILPLSHPREVIATRSNLKGVVTHPVGVIFFKNAVKE